MICPNCHQDAPTVLRGARPFCTACGAPRPLLAATQAVSLAGQPAKVGGSVVGVAAVLALFAGGTIATLLGVLAQLLFHTGVMVATPIAIVTVLIAISLFFSGRKLRATGEGQALSARRDALAAIAGRTRGVVTVRDAARVLSISEAEADATLTAMAKDPSGNVSLEVDDAGELTFVFRDLVPHPRIVDTGPAQAPGARPRDAAIDAQAKAELEAQAEAEAAASATARAPIVARR